MAFNKIAIVAALALFVDISTAGAQQIPAGRRIAQSLFSCGALEPSALDYIASSGLLVGASDTGDFFFINATNHDQWWHFNAVTGSANGLSVKNNWEGITVDTGDSSDHLYIIFEGTGDGNDHARLTKISYNLITANSCGNGGSYAVESVVNLSVLTPYLTNNDGIESLTLYKPSSGTKPPEFLAGVQKTGILYSVSADNQLTGVVLEQASRGRVSGSQYLPALDVLLVVGDKNDQLQSIDVSNNCVLQTWSTRGTNEEGLVLVGSNLYIADDSGGMWVHPGFQLDGNVSCGSPAPSTSPTTQVPTNLRTRASVISTNPPTEIPLPMAATEPPISVRTFVCLGPNASCLVNSDCCTHSCLSNGECSTNRFFRTKYH